MFMESIKEGFRLTHRNSQLVYIRMALGLINIIGFFLIVGGPAAAAAKSIGMDLSNASGLFNTLLKDPFDILSKYLVLLLIIFVAFIVYLIFSSLLHLYVLSGTLGVLKNSVTDMRYSFSFSSFLSESGKHFFPLMWLMSVTFMGLFLVLTVFLILSIIGFDIREPVSGAGSFINVFVSSFINLAFVVFGSIISLAAFVFVVYSMAVSVIEGSGVMNSLRKTSIFLKDRPSAFIYYFVLFFGIFAVNVLILLFEVPMGMASDGRLLMTLMAAFTGIAIQSYLMVALWSCLIVFYVKATNLIVHQPAYDI